MPIYEYQCTGCGIEIEKLQKMSDEPLKDCPDCGKPALRKKVSAAAFRLKGSGWYETDFKNAGKKPDAPKNDAGKSDPGKQGTDKKESKTKDSGTSNSGSTTTKKKGSDK